MFKSDGKLLLDSHKSIIMHKIEENIQEIQGDKLEADAVKITTEIFTLFGMTVVSSIEFRPVVQNSQQFSEAFLKIILGQATDD